jgi:hypothetical protein
VTVHEHFDKERFIHDHPIHDGFHKHVNTPPHQRTLEERVQVLEDRFRTHLDLHWEDVCPLHWEDGEANGHVY